MPIDAFIKDGTGRGYIAKVNKQGNLITSQDKNDIASKAVLSATTVYNLREPRAGQQFIITGVILNAARSVSIEALISVFESSVFQGASTKGIIAVDVAKDSTIPLIGLYLAVGEGKWLSCTTDDPTCNVTLLGHYISV
jgi:hypothetical protein